MSNIIENLIPKSVEAAGQARAVANGALESVRATLAGSSIDDEQFAAHGLAWVATYASALEQMAGWAERLESAGNFGELEKLILQSAFGEYLNQMAGGIAMSQVETVRPADMAIDDNIINNLNSGAAAEFQKSGNTSAVRMKIASLLDFNTSAFGNDGLNDETLEMVSEQFRRYATEEIAPNANGWHEKDILIPIEIIEQMSELGVFGLTIDEQYGGLDMGKTAMCVVTEELSRGYLGVGSLGTRSEIAAELISLGGTDAQKQKYLPRISTGEILPTAVFTEPNTGSDLASLKTKAEKTKNGWRISGAKTWITHAARSDLMTVLARTDPTDPGYKGLSMFLIEKPRGTDDEPFPISGLSGTEIKVLGYRGMKEYELAFDGMEIPDDALLGGVPGNGFKQLMATFEAARIQTAARAVGVAAGALELGLRYAHERSQFGKALINFPRVAGKLAWMAVEAQIARQLTHFAAREKDAGHRSDIVAGQAKLLAARVAWANADNALQIHGGNGYAVEYPISRVLVDSRILNIFEGAAEIQAHVIARGLLK
ncbi:MAG: acyl-CoA/acyl-ACP dehydrogenase [Rhodospirillaceae bacterium]|nr:acyl-CoA/acyl-ACP dehydrogenase [Rhodospirillaceae bacterium]